MSESQLWLARVLKMQASVDVTNIQHKRINKFLINLYKLAKWYNSLNTRHQNLLAGFDSRSDHTKDLKNGIVAAFPTTLSAFTHGCKGAVLPLARLRSLKHSKLIQAFKIACFPHWWLSIWFAMNADHWNTVTFRYSFSICYTNPDETKM